MSLINEIMQQELTFLSGCCEMCTTATDPQLQLITHEVSSWWPCQYAKYTYME
jgi:hypothetical protein